mmetsp:Transcript_71761/g.191461  ORF Transcript_71761/g.191461 Transcript_71761/m.191461 type:complete len:229 (-) Transcript_71761:1384-2070(-)
MQICSMDSFSGYGGMYPSNCTFIQSVNSFPVSTPHTRNEHGYFNPVIGATIDQNSGYPSGRYKIIRVLGTGVYGTVLECEDKKHGTPVAIKLCRARPEFETAALGEIRALRDLEGRHGTPALLRSFQYEGHICMAFNMLGENLKSVIDRCLTTTNAYYFTFTMSVLIFLCFAGSEFSLSLKLWTCLTSSSRPLPIFIPRGSSTRTSKQTMFLFVVVSPPRTILQDHSF